MSGYDPESVREQMASCWTAPLLSLLFYTGRVLLPSVCPNGLFPVLGMIPETQVTIDVLQYKGVTLMQRKTLFFHDAKNLFPNLFMQLCICGLSDILFLNSRIDNGCIVMVVLIILVIHANTFLKNEFNFLFTYTVAEMTSSGGTQTE